MRETNTLDTVTDIRDLTDQICRKLLKSFGKTTIADATPADLAKLHEAADVLERINEQLG